VYKSISQRYCVFFLTGGTKDWASYTHLYTLPESHDHSKAHTHTHTHTDTHTHTERERRTGIFMIINIKIITRRMLREGFWHVVCVCVCVCVCECVCSCESV